VTHSAAAETSTRFVFAHENECATDSFAIES